MAAQRGYNCGMGKRRGHREGSINQLPSGSWRARITLDGRRLSHTAPTRRAAQDWIRNIQQEIDSGLSYRGVATGMVDFVDNWLVSVSSSLRPRTLAHYQQIARDYIKPQLGKFRIRDVRPEHIQALYNQLTAQGKSPHLVDKVHTVLQQIFNHAYGLRLITIPPTTGVIVPVAQLEEMRILDENQVSRLLIAANETRYGPLMHLAVSTGMRQMELLGLRWEDLDWNRHHIHVRRQLVRKVRGQDWQFAQPKTQAGRRIVPLGLRVFEALKAQNTRQQLERRAAGKRWTDYGMIFATRVGTPIMARNLLDDYRAILRAAALPRMRFHDLRHTAASLMLVAGVPISTVSYILGHSNAAITLKIYAHIIPATIPPAMELLDELIAPVPLILDK